MLPLLRRNLDAVRGRILAAQARSDRAAAATELVVVTKSVPEARVAEVLEALVSEGVRHAGESRVAAAARRRRTARRLTPPHTPPLTWHGIGHLQRNKARLATSVLDVFHGLDSGRLARHLETILESVPRGTEGPWPVYIQVNAAADPAKGGCTPDDALRFLADVTALPHLDPIGFMTIARLGADEAGARATFRTLREIRDEAARRGVGRRREMGLSMGMSDDFEWAVEEGATVVRVGSAVLEGVVSGAGVADAARVGDVQGEGGGS